MKKLKCILLVDDDPTVMFINTSLIRQWEAAEELLTAHNGKEALSLLEQLSQSQGGSQAMLPDLILLDISMPIMDGFEFLQAFEQLPLPQRPLVALLTSSMHPSDQQKARQFNIAQLLNKPLTNDSLCSLIGKCFP